jgi:hypothetical protein
MRPPIHGGSALWQALEGVAPPRKSRLGGLRGELKVPDDFDRMCQAEIEEMFYGK